jgi:hypothetical protein
LKEVLQNPFRALILLMVEVAEALVVEQELGESYEGASSLVAFIPFLEEASFLAAFAPLEAPFQEEASFQAFQEEASSQASFQASLAYQA